MDRDRDDGPRRRFGPVKRGAWNHAIVVLGLPGTGKSTWALARARELARTPAYVLAHDPGWRLPERLPDGRDPRLLRVESIADARAALVTSPGATIALATADGADVVELGLALGAASIERGKGAGAPVVVLLDEAVGTSGASPYRLGEQLRELIATRRHHHVGVIITAQSPQLAHYALLGLATEIVLFRLRDERALARLEQVGVPRETLARLPTMPDYECVVTSVG